MRRPCPSVDGVRMPRAASNPKIRWRRAAHCPSAEARQSLWNRAPRRMSGPSSCLERLHVLEVGALDKNSMAEFYAALNRARPDANGCAWRCSCLPTNQAGSRSVWRNLERRDELRMDLVSAASHKTGFSRRRAAEEPERCPVSCWDRRLGCPKPCRTRRQPLARVGMAMRMLSNVTRAI